uniref:ERBB receptor feedback inhibitor 1 n=1 Tax=Gadus morhua TaxID=8049 RepID=A0A8C5CCF8_GADMO
PAPPLPSSSSSPSSTSSPTPLPPPPPLFPPCQTALCSATHRLAQCRNDLLRPPEGDQVVPSFQRLTVLEGHRQRPKPLPPPPDPEELMADEAADSEVEFFTSDQRSLLPKSSGGKAPCFRATSRGSYGGFGQVNYAYQGVTSAAAAVPAAGGEGGAGAASQRWSAVGADAGATTWRAASSSRNPADAPLPSGLRYSYPGPDKPVVPPRAPIPPPKSSALHPRTLRGDTSAAQGRQEEDRPPKVPPRLPLVATYPPRTPSPKSLPIYINGVMPATQSFAPNPKYVRRGPLPRQQRARAPPADQSAPCIVPVMKDGRQASATHYFLLPRPAYQERLQRILSQPERADHGAGAWPTPDMNDPKR